MSFAEHNWPVVALSAAGLFFIFLGLLSLALPTSLEGDLLWELNGRHALNLMDAAGAFALALGLALTWIGSKLWNRQLLA
ncbi:MAG: hypothetical protein ACP5HG_18490 [Anaerolineae bacterium]|jgi:hypothetical protein